MKATCALVAILLTMIFQHLAFAGGEAPNGTDNPPDGNGSAWFLGANRTIHYCFVSSPDFGVSSEAISQKIKSAFATWASYIAATAADDDLLGPDYKFATSVEEMPACDGTQDLKFDFGVSDSDVVGQMLLYANPTAFAYRKSFDPRSGWSQGMIWFSPPGKVNPEMGFPNWAQDETLSAILLHELGHVFGVSHIDKTIMSATLSNQLMTGQLPLAFQTSIDWKRDLLFCVSCSMESNPGVLGTGVEVDEDVKVFQFLTGRAPEGTISAAIVPGSSTRLSQRLAVASGGSLVVSDGRGSYSFKMTVALQTDDPRFDSDSVIFKRFKAGVTTGLRNQGGVSFGSLQLSASRQQDIVIEFNSTNEDSVGPITIKYLRDGLPHTIFRAFPMPFNPTATFNR